MFGRHRDDRLQVAVAGVGAQRAAQAAKHLLADGARALVSWGVVGGLSAEWAPGDVVLAERIDSDAGTEHVSTDWNQALLQTFMQAGVDARMGVLRSHAHAVTSVHEKQQLAVLGYAIVDMEAAAVAHAAGEAGVPFVAIKCVCDPVLRALPPVAMRLLRPDGRIRFSMLISALLRGPPMWRTLHGMSRDFDMACAGLGRAAPALVASCPA